MQSAIPANSSSSHDIVNKQSLAALSIAAAGIVYGDIGTSPLYALQTVFSSEHGINANYVDVLGVLSLVFWSLLIVVSLKFVVFIMRADNKGEGGIMALIALMQRVIAPEAPIRRTFLLLGLFGAALFFGDGIITPAISVLSAVEGLEVGAPGLKTFVIPISLGILVALFFIQRKGTATVGILFGPIMLIWFAILAILGGLEIYRYPAVLHALNPSYGIDFLAKHKVKGFLSLGAVVLTVTGAEALYADMGHFGKTPIRLAWFLFVLPALVLNYFGQGAIMILDPSTAANPFYALSPKWALYPMVGLSTVATVIASQAVISGVFSMTHQATQLGFMPRMNVVHTSARQMGQIYVPVMNWVMMLGVIALIFGFQSSSNLGWAYGLAVTGTIAIDTLLVFAVARGLWKWNWAYIIIGATFFLIIDLAFLGANLVKIFEGGWFPLAVGVFMFTLMTTWKRGREILAQRQQAQSIALKPFLAGLASHPPLRVPGTAVFLTTNLDNVPHAMLHNLVHNKVIHETVLFLTVKIKDEPWVDDADRILLEVLGDEFYRVTVNYGFKDGPDLPLALAGVKIRGVALNLMETSFFLSRETLITTAMPGMAPWREKLFVSMARNGSSATAFFHIPTNRVIELGTQVEL
ncbi:MAG TPA: potassium transporter Kup [Burkholderiales bacterium]|nr:potassium transporter Kup [Burkholderiales bacterium]